MAASVPELIPVPSSLVCSNVYIHYYSRVVNSSFGLSEYDPAGLTALNNAVRLRVGI